MAEAYIVAAVRTAGGRRGGNLSGWHPVDLGAQVINALIARSGIDPQRVEDVLMGCVSQAGEQSSNVGRNAVLASILPESVPGTTIDRQCGSSQQALHFAAQAIMSGTMDVVIAAGVESMSRVPMNMPSVLPRQNGMGHYMSPGIRERYQGPEFSQFLGAEAIARKYDISKDAMDNYALESHRRAIAATQAGAFADEILVLPVRRVAKDGSAVVEAAAEPQLHGSDEGIRYDVTAESIAGVKSLQEGGRLSAATASQMCDGASGLLLVSEKALKELGLTPLARIHHLSVIGHDPDIMLEAPIPATLQALKKTGMSVADIDLFEVNEAFASVPLAWLQATGADPARMNVNGGAIALGHPLGASGAKLMTTLIYALRRRGKRFGLQTMCEGGGMANVTIVELLPCEPS